jgi:hypothetical protein
MANSQDLSRRALLTTAAAAASSLLIVTGASAGAIPQAAVKYQTSPNDGKHCSNCKLFIPGATADATGTCKSVAGAINPNGWCVLFAAKDA